MLRRPRPIRRSSRFLSKPELVVLWINRARHLAQQLHHSVHITSEELTPPGVTALLRDAISVLLHNIVALGKASVTYSGNVGAGNLDFFVPREGTTLFGMAERFVDLYGYHDDTKLLDRAMLFENLSSLQRSMVGDAKYASYGVDFPGFEFSDDVLRWYGIPEFVKGQQRARLADGRPEVFHPFGYRLPRYQTGPVPLYDRSYIDLWDLSPPTRPGTPAVVYASLEGKENALRRQGAVASLGISVLDRAREETDVSENSESTT